jgi:heme/copper-type cytochrome/quinol oxidase subunit 2
MFKLFITLQVAMLAVIATMEDRVAQRRGEERGSVTIEQVIWAGAVIVIVAIVVAAIKAFVTSEAGKIQ